MTLDEFFAGQDLSRQLFEVVAAAIDAIGPADMRVSKSQVSFRRKRAFAWVWTPGRYLRGKVAPLVLTLALGSRHPSPRWKEIVEPSPGHFTHHLELFSADDVDEEVCSWLAAAWERAG